MPTPSSSPSESASPRPTPPAMPAEAEGTSPAAAKAFVRHYFEQINYAALSGDTETLRELSTDDCESCDAIASNVERIYNAGGHMETEGWKLSVVSSVPSRPSLRPAFDLGVQQSPETVLESGDDPSPKRYPGGRLAMTIYIKWSGSRWEVDRLDEVAT